LAIKKMLNLKNPGLLRNQSYINGQWVDSDSGEILEVRAAATDEVITRIASLGADETRRAIESAEAAMPAWADKSAQERANILRKWCNLILAHIDDLAQILTLEQGKPLAEAKDEIIYGAHCIEWFAEEAKRIYGDVIPNPSNGQRLVATKRPVGVVAAMTAWNLPNAAISRKAGPALAAGCTFVGKPATETSLSALALAVLAEEAGIPAGVFNLVCGKYSRAIGDEMISNPMVRKLAFSGFGREGSNYGIEDYVEIKYLCLGGIDKELTIA